MTRDIGMVAGFRVITDDNMIVPDGMKMVKKSFYERLTWKFWISKKEVPVYRASSIIYTFGDKIICHPEIALGLKDRLEAKAM